MKTGNAVPAVRVSPGSIRSSDWEMISSFMLSLPEERPVSGDCQIEPIAAALQPLGIEDHLLCDISAEVVRAGELMRHNCPEGRLQCVNVRLHVSRWALREARKGAHQWSFYAIQQIASSESDNLEALENPRCYIDLHVY